MSNTIILKNGTTTPDNTDLEIAEPGFKKNTGTLYIGNGDKVVQINPIISSEEPERIPGALWIDTSIESSTEDSPLPISQGGTGASNAADALANLGAAPAGYGLGVATPEKEVSDCNLAVRNGWYKVTGNASNAPWNLSSWMRVDAYNENYLIQTIYNEADGCRVAQRLKQKTFGEWEWVNPPMVAGVEYRTTERSGGKVVYKKLQDGVIHYRLDGETDWKLYSGIVGAAPSGYGYGGQSVALKNNSLIADEDDLDNELAKIYDAMNVGETKMITFFGYPSNSDWRFFGILSKSSASNGSLIAHSAYGAGSKIIKQKYGGAWQPCEWENPPMVAGVEYRTTERCDGKPVYRKSVVYTHSGKFGDSATNTDYTIPHGISGWVRSVRCVTSINNDVMGFYLGSDGGFLCAYGFGATNINVRAYKTYFNSPIFRFDLAYIKE